MNLWFWKIGDDPEFGYVDPKAGQLFDMSEYIAHDRNFRMNCFAGTDGHAMNAELRPGPTRNIYYQMSRLADGLLQIEEKLAGWRLRRPALKHVRLTAMPTIGNECFGGHIHLSFFVKDSHLFRSVVNGVVPYDAVSYIGRLHNGAGRIRIPEALAAPRIPEPDYNEKREFDMKRVLNRLRYLLLPLEDALNYPNNLGRKDAHLVKDPLFRMPNAYTPIENEWIARAVREGKTYLRFEYREPSSWLDEPLKAYCFLALAKFVMLNINKIPPHDNGDYDERVFHSVKAAPKNAQEEFFRRWLSVIGRRPTFTPDLHALPEALSQVMKFTVANKSEDFWLVNLPAWERYRLVS